MPTYSCDLCFFSSANKFNLETHLKTEKHQFVANAVGRVTHKLEQQVAEFEAESKQADEKMRDMEKTIEYLRESNTKLESLVEKAVLKTTTVNNINRIKTVNNLHLLSPEDIKWKTLTADVAKLVNATSVLDFSAATFNSGIATALLKDSQGQNKVLCTDISRKQFQYKDEGTGELVSDPHLERLRDKMRQGVDHRRLFIELCDELDAQGGDKNENSALACKLVKRAKFNDGFVKHVANQTYRRSCIQFID